MGAPGLHDLVTLVLLTDTSLFGGRRVGAQITGGLDLTGASFAERGPYALEQRLCFTNWF